MDKPHDIFDRDREWRALGAFVADPSPGTTLGVVSGRRRQGKTMLLQALVEATGGFFHEAAVGSPAEQRRRLAVALSRHLALPADLDLPDWETAIAALIRVHAMTSQRDPNRSVTVVLDEMPYLVAADPAVPSLLQAALAPRGPAANIAARLLVCGSAVGMMGQLLGGQAPLRGRAGLELIVAPFDYRTMAQFWGLDDPRLAVLTHAVVGGTPAYRREFVRSDAPRGLTGFSAWVTDVVLDPSRPLLHEGRYLLAEDPDLAAVRDRGLYVSTLAAVAAGHRTHARIGGFLGRRSDDLTHVLQVLEDASLLTRREDLLRRRRPTYAIADPFLRFHLSVIRPAQAMLAAGHADRVWQDSAQTFAAQVLGPMFEEICRHWLRDHASTVTLGGVPAEVGSAVVNDPASRHTYEVDLLVLGPRLRDRRRAVLLIGEAKWDTPLGLTHVRRLERIRALLSQREDLDASNARLLLASGAPFDPDLGDLTRPDLELVGPERLYESD